MGCDLSTRLTKLVWSKVLLFSLGWFGIWWMVSATSQIGRQQWLKEFSECNLSTFPQAERLYSKLFENNSYSNKYFPNVIYNLLIWTEILLSSYIHFKSIQLSNSITQSRLLFPQYTLTLNQIQDDGRFPCDELGSFCVLKLIQEWATHTNKAINEEAVADLWLHLAALPLLFSFHQNTSDKLNNQSKQFWGSVCILATSKRRYHPKIHTRALHVQLINYCWEPTFVARAL